MPCLFAVDCEQELEDRVGLFRDLSHGCTAFLLEQGLLGRVGAKVQRVDRLEDGGGVVSRAVDQVDENRTPGVKFVRCPRMQVVSEPWMLSLFRSFLVLDHGTGTRPTPPF